MPLCFYFLNHFTNLFPIRITSQAHETMITPKITRFGAQHNDASTTSTTINAPDPVGQTLLPPPDKDDLILIIYHSTLTLQNPSLPMIDLGTFQVLPTFQFSKQSLQYQASKQPPSQPLILGHEMLQSLQQLQANLDIQGENNMLKKFYNLMHQQNSHFLAE